METKDPALTKTPISSHDTIAEIITDTTSKHYDHTHKSAAHAEKERKGTQTLQETVIGSSLIDDFENLDDSIDANMANRSTQRQIAGESVVHEDSLRKTVVDEELAQRDVINHNKAVKKPMPAHNHDKLESETSVTNYTDTFEDEVLDTEHVNDGDNPARQPDRRDQQGSTAFDEGINDDTVGSEAPKSESINNMNRYASVDNAQSRVLNPDEKDKS